MAVFRFDVSFKQVFLKKPLNALLISDLHLSDEGRNYFSQQAIEKTENMLLSLVKEINPSQIFVLGDLFHVTQQNTPYASQIMEFFRNLESEVFIIGGNHDQVLIDALSEEWSDSNLHIYPDTFLIYETGYEKIWFTHDGMNALLLHKSEVTDFITSLKRVYHIDTHDWLITGHTHLPCLLKEDKAASIGCFNAGKKYKPLSYGHATIQAKRISIKLQSMEI